MFHPAFMYFTFTTFIYWKILEIYWKKILEKLSINTTMDPIVKGYGCDIPECFLPIAFLCFYLVVSEQLDMGHGWNSKPHM